MRQYIAPQVLIVNGKPSPCECTNTIICAYCVRANLVLWNKQEEERPKFDVREAIQKIHNYGIRNFSREFNVPMKTISAWDESGFIPHNTLRKIDLFFRT